MLQYPRIVFCKRSSRSLFYHVDTKVIEKAYKSGYRVFCVVPRLDFNSEFFLLIVCNICICWILLDLIYMGHRQSDCVKSRLRQVFTSCA